MKEGLENDKKTSDDKRMDNYHEKAFGGDDRK